MAQFADKTPERSLAILPEDDITPAMSRQQIRQIGIKNLIARLKKQMPRLSRRELRELAYKLHSAQWSDRDLKIIDSVKRGGQVIKKGGNRVRAELAGRSKL